MSGIWGSNYKLSIFGESHGKAIGMVLNGLPVGIELDMEQISKEMERRAPGRDNLSTPRVEGDQFEIVSGILDDITTGAPLCSMIWNSSQRSKDYSHIRYVMRPGHADYPGFVKYKGFNDYRGGGHFSGRITAPVVFAGAVAKQILARKGITIGAHIKSIGSVSEESFDAVNLNAETLLELAKKPFPVIDQSAGEAMKQVILEAKEELDSVGGTVEVGVTGIPVGIGDPFFDSVESKIASLVFSVPGTKGLEFGAGFAISDMKGSESNDEYYMDGDAVKTYTNNNGGITGGISNGMPIVYSVAIKPTSSISKKQRTIDVKEQSETELEVHGRHDPCIVHRTVPVLEAITAIAILDLILGEEGASGFEPR